NMVPWPVAKPDLHPAAADPFVVNSLMSNFVATTSNMLFTREVFEKVGGMRNLRFAHDWDFLMRVASRFRCIQVDEPLIEYRVHGSNTISSNRAWMLFEICWVRAANLPYFEGNLLFGLGARSEMIKQVEFMAHAFNFQGNDKVFWMIREFAEAR